MLRNKVAIITGGARGIGRAIAVLFARHGAGVVIASRTLSQLRDAVKEIQKENRQVFAVKTDVSKRKDVDTLVRKTLKEFGRIDILVNNAGVIGPIGPIIKNDTQDWLNAININFIGTFLCIKAVIPHMIKQRAGKIIDFSGGGAVYPRPNFSAYSASKAAVVKLTETLAKELKPYNIQVNAIAPGAVNTEITKAILKAGKLAGKKELEDSKKCLKTGGVSPYKAAELALFLASSNSGSLTGKLISAVWDDWKSFNKKISEITHSSIYTLRRIDEKYFKEVK